MELINAFVQNPVKVSVGVLIVVLFGTIALIRMPMQLTPEVQRPTITVETLWPGGSPQEVEQEIVMEQEEQLKSVEGITKLSSESADSMGRITMEFSVDTDMEESLLKVNSRLQQVREYPEEADQPVISTSNVSDRPIAWFILSPRRPSNQDLTDFVKRHPETSSRIDKVRNAHSVGVAMLYLREYAAEQPVFRELLPPEDLEVIQLRRFTEDEIEARFERVPGVSQSNVIGGLEEELQVVVDPERLAARQLTLGTVRDVLRGQNADTSAGDFWEGKRRWVVRTLNQFREPEQVANQLLAIRDGAPVFVRDVAEVCLGYKKPDGIVRRFGESSISVNCLRETGANVLDVMHGLQDAMDDLNENVLGPRGLQLTQVYDETEYIVSAVDLVRQNIFVGGALTVIVLMCFLHLNRRTILSVPLILVTAIMSAYISPWFFLVCLTLLIGAGFWFARGALVVSLAIPTSIVGTFLVLGLLGRSLNVISLAGMAFAVGMLVDNAVVVLENIYRHYSSGESPFAATVRGTNEVIGAVAASTLTTIAVFLPVIFVQEEAGQLFQDIALAISAAVGLSMIVSVTVIPPAASRLLHPRDSNSHEAEHHEGKPSWIVRVINGFGANFVYNVVAMNRWIQHGFFRRIAVVAILVGTSLGITWAVWPKVDYLPMGNRNLIFGILMPPPGYNLDQLLELGQTVEDRLRPYWSTDPNSEEAKELDYPIIGDFFFVARGRQVFMGLRAHDPERASELVALVQQTTAGLPGTFGVAKQSSLFEQGLSAGRTIDIEISGPDLRQLVALGGQTLGKVKEILPTAQARPVPSLDLSSPELHIEPKLVQCADMGIDARMLGFFADALVDGAYVGDYYLDGKKIDLTLAGELAYADNTADIAGLPVATPIGQLVPLSALANIALASGPEQVNHRERVRAITIEVSPPAEMALEDAMQQIESQIVVPLREQGRLAGGYRMTLSGTADKLRETWEALRFNIILALLITYLLMAALFESWLYPFVIILSVPLGAVGGVLGLQLLNFYVFQPLDILTMLGFVILIGTVVNNPILIVHQSLNLMRDEQMPMRQAILESVQTRIRPIFMTTTTTVLGLLPLVLFPGAGSELYRGLGSVVLGGLIVSTVFTLVLVPTLFSLTLDIKSAIVRMTLGRESKEFDATEPVGEAIVA